VNNSWAGRKTLNSHSLVTAAERRLWLLLIIWRHHYWWRLQNVGQWLSLNIWRHHYWWRLHNISKWCRSFHYIIITRDGWRISTYGCRLYDVIITGDGCRILVYAHHVINYFGLHDSLTGQCVFINYLLLGNIGLYHISCSLNTPDVNHLLWQNGHLKGAKFEFRMKNSDRWPR
jgi:hypothetical protein